MTAYTNGDWRITWVEPGDFLPTTCRGVTVTLPPPGHLPPWCLECARADAAATKWRLAKALTGQPGDIANICRTCGHISYYRREGQPK